MSTIHSVETDPRPKANTTASVAKAQAENQSGVANRLTTIGESPCQKTAVAEALATERRLQNCIWKIAVLYG